MGNPNIGLCKELLNICSSCTRAYSFMRNEILKKGLIMSGNDIPDSELSKSFDNIELNESDFNLILKNIDMTSKIFKQFKKAILKIA